MEKQTEAKMVEEYHKSKESKTSKSHRKISSEKYIIAGVITILLFSLGLTLGLVIEDKSYDIVQEINQEQEVRSLSLQLQYLFLTSFENQNNCPILSTALRETVRDLDESLSKVINEAEEGSDSIRSTLVRRRYIIDNIRYWLLAQEGKNSCDLDIVPILYFYTEDCSSCVTQGTILSYFKTVFEEKVLVFPINLDLRDEEPMVEIMMLQFGVDKFPTIVINDKKYEGVLRREPLQEIICESLQDSEQCQ